MMYTARTQRELFIFLLLITIASVTRNDFFTWLVYFQIFFSFILMFVICIKYTFEIKQESLSYQVLFLKWTIYKKVVYPHQVIQFTFKRIGWYPKGAIIQVNQGMNIRVIYFSPKTVMVDLIDYANKNDIPISKTKEYIMLEK